MKCEKCGKVFKDLLKHLTKSKECQSAHNMDEIYRNRRQERLGKMRSYYQEKKKTILKKIKNYESDNKVTISLKKKAYYEKEKQQIRSKQKVYYQKSIGKKYQYKRFRNYFRRVNAQSYITPEQEHLYIILTQ